MFKVFNMIKAKFKQLADSFDVDEINAETLDRMIEIKEAHKQKR